MNTNKKAAMAVALLAAMAPVAANASFVLDTGSPGASTMPMTLDGNDFYAAEFNLSAGQTVNSISAFVTGGADQPGATFTLAIYSAADFGSRNAAQQAAGQATYTADGWTGISNVGWTATTPGAYWAAVEVGSADSALGLNLPTPVAGGTAPALAFAFNSGAGYAGNGALPFGIQVDATTPVPLPAAAWLLGSAVFGMGALVRRRAGPGRR